MRFVIGVHIVTFCDAEENKNEPGSLKIYSLQRPRQYKENTCQGNRLAEDKNSRLTYIGEPR